MELTVGLVFVSVFLVAYLFLRKKQNLPPGYMGFPLIGSVSFLSTFKAKRPHIVVFEASKRLGRIFRFYIGTKLVVVLSGYDIIHEALVTQKEVFSGRDNNLSKAFRGAFSEKTVEEGIILNEYGTPWRESRRFAVQALRDFGVGKTSLETKINEELNAAVSYFESMAGNPTAVRDIMQKVVANVLYSVIFGKRYDYDDPEFDRVRALTDAAITGPGVINPGNFMPAFISSILFRKAKKIDEARIKAFVELKNYIYGVIEDHENSFDESNIRDFIDIYIQTSRSQGNELKKYITKSNMFRIIFDLFLAGSESTFTSLDWAFLFMIEYPEVQKRCREEIVKEIGDKPVGYSDRNKLSYVNATIIEIQRLGNIAPFGVAHATLKDTTLDGYDIPKGTLVLPALYSVSMDEKYFPNPTRFDPDRHIDAKGNLIKNEAVIPFSTGPRMCAGEPLARMELFLMLTSLLQKFTFEREHPELRHSFEARQNQITNAPLPYKLRATRIH